MTLLEADTTRCTHDGQQAYFTRGSLSLVSNPFPSFLLLAVWKRNATTVVRTCVYEVEMESDTKRRRRRLTRVYKCSDTVEQRMLPAGSNNEMLTDPNSIGTI